MVSMTDKVKAKLAKNPDPSPETIQKWADEIGCSTSLVYKWRGRVGVEALETAKRIGEPSQPIVKIEEEAEIIEEPIEEEEPEFEVPSDFMEEEEGRVEPVEEAEEIGLEEKPEDEQILNDIGKRAIKRLFGLAIEEGLGLGKGYGLTDQESEDTQFLSFMLIAKYLQVQIKENILEVTSALHFGSVGLKLLVVWIKKRREEARKRKEEEERRKPEPEKPKEEEMPVEKAPPVEEPKPLDQGKIDREFQKKHIH